jgi:hypothetical protein
MADSMADGLRTVLVHFYERVRPVKFIGDNKEALADSFKSAFKDVLQGGSIEAVIFQVSYIHCSYSG